jgi:hypothetical protein
VSEAATAEKSRSDTVEGGIGGPASGWRNPAVIGLLGACACAGILLLILQTRFGFVWDEWDFLVYRRGASAATFLDPHNDHIALAPVMIYKVLLAAFGMDSALPFQAVSTFLFLLSAVLLFAYMRRRVGDWAALFGTSLMLFLGAGWPDLLWAFQIGFSGSIAAGLGALLALDRNDRLGDRIACVLLVVATSFSELGVPFVAGAMISIALGGRDWRSRAYVALVPLVLYAIWWLGWGHTAEGAYSLENIVTSPGYVFDAVSQAIASLFGLATPLTGSGSEPVGLNWGRILLVAGIVLFAWRVRRIGGIPRGFWIVAAVGFTFWFLAAFNESPFRAATSGRYQYPGAVFVLLIAAELLRRVRVGRRTLTVAGVVAVAAVISGVVFLHEGYKILKGNSDAERAQLAALEVARPAVDPGYVLHFDPLGLWSVDARSYFSAIDAFGSPAFSESELASAPAGAQANADRALVSALRIRMTAGRRAAPPSSAGGGRPSGCRTLQAAPIAPPPVDLRPGEVTIQRRAGPGVEVLLGRFFDRFSVDLGPLQPARAGSFTLPADGSTSPWRLGVRGTGPVTVCEVDRS